MVCCYSVSKFMQYAPHDSTFSLAGLGPRAVAYPGLLAPEGRSNAVRSAYLPNFKGHGWLGSRVLSELDSGAEGPGFKSQPRRCRVTVLGKLFTPIVPLYTKQQNW